MPGKKKSALEQIRHRAKALRESNPQKYGVVGATKGERGYVKNGWQRAISDMAIIMYPERH